MDGYRYGLDGERRPMAKKSAKPKKSKVKVRDMKPKKNPKGGFVSRLRVQ
jgi:hypothetical protein